MKKSSKKGQED